jgi:hypothetical protein
MAADASRQERSPDAASPPPSCACERAIRRRRVDDQRRKLAHPAKRLRLAVERRRCLEMAGVDGFIAGVRDLNGA